MMSLRARSVVLLAVLIVGVATAARGLVAPQQLQPADKDYALFGNGARFVGDVNGDGFGDVVVGATHYDTAAEPSEPFQGEGRAYLFLGSADGLEATAAWSKDPTDAAAARFGTAIAGVGDLSGDGLADVLIGAPGVSKVYLYLGTSSGLAAAPPWHQRVTSTATASLTCSSAATTPGRCTSIQALRGRHCWPPSRCGPRVATA
jgi:hypothetical protein